MYYICLSGVFYEYQFGKGKNKTNPGRSAYLDDIRSCYGSGCRSADRPFETGQSMHLHCRSVDLVFVVIFCQPRNVSQSKWRPKDHAGDVAVACHRFHAADDRLPGQQRCDGSQGLDPRSCVQSARQFSRSIDQKTREKRNEGQEVCQGEIS